MESKDPLAKLMKDAPRGSRRNALLRWCQNRTVGYKVCTVNKNLLDDILPMTNFEY